LLAFFIRRTGFALYSSVGILDITCSEKVKIGAIKDFLCSPVLLSKRSLVQSYFDKSWTALQNSDSTVLQYCAKKQETMKTLKGSFDPNEFSIPFTFLSKLLKNTDFNYFMQPATTFGKRGISLSSVCRLSLIELLFVSFVLFRFRAFSFVLFFFLLPSIFPFPSLLT
jgi:hypothetical protein